MRRSYIVAVIVSIGLLYCAPSLVAQVVPNGTGGECPRPTTMTRPLINWGVQNLQVSTVALSLTAPAAPTTAPQKTIIYAVGTTATAPSAQYGTNYRSDGTAPTGTLGTGGSTATGQVLIVCTNAISKIQLIRNGTSDTLWQFEYFGL